MIKNVDRATAWLEGLAARGIRVRLREHNLELSPRSAFGTLTNDELLTLNNDLYRASIKSLLRNEWQPLTQSADTTTSTLEAGRASPLGRPSLPGHGDTAGTSIEAQRAPDEVVPSPEPSKPADLSDATASPGTRSSPTTEVKSSDATPPDLVVAADQVPDPERAARLRIVAANTAEEIERRAAAATQTMLHQMPRGHRDWS